MLNGNVFLARPQIVIFPLFFTLAALHYFFGYYFWGLENFSVGNDDSFITYRYAANLVDHGVISFNPFRPCSLHFVPTALSFLPLSLPIFLSVESARLHC